MKTGAVIKARRPRKWADAILFPPLSEPISQKEKNWLMKAPCVNRMGLGGPVVPEKCTTIQGSSWTSARAFEKSIGGTDCPVEVDRKEETEGTTDTVIGWAERMA